jgi:hypothetical protein
MDDFDELSNQTHLLDEGTATAVDHQNIRCLPTRHLAILIFITFRITLGCVNIRVTKIIIGVVHILGDGSPVWWDSKECFSMIVSFLLKEKVRDLRLTVKRGESSNIIKSYVSVRFRTLAAIKANKKHGHSDPTSSEKRQRSNRQRSTLHISPSKNIRPSQGQHSLISHHSK